MRTRALLTSLLVPAAAVALATISAAPASANTPASLETRVASSFVLPAGVLGGQYTCHFTPGTYSATGDSWSCDYTPATSSASAITMLGLLCADGTTTYAADRAVFTCPRADVATG